MPATVRCEDCGLTLLSFDATGPEPIEYDECPECGGTEFSFVE